MLRCSTELRRATKDAPTMEEAAQRVCRAFYDELVAPDGSKACALVRCYRTHPYGQLEPELQSFAKAALQGQTAGPTMRCLTLLGSAGDEPAWNSRRTSVGHQAIPLASAEMIAKAPMIAQLIRQFGLEVADVVQPTTDLVRSLQGKTYGVFHVPEAVGSPYIPAQKDFVLRFGIRSVVGFGGSLPSGDLFAVILFTRVPVSSETADRFRNLALDVKSGFFPYRDTDIFNPQPVPAGGGKARATLRT
ncbi:MAG: hypothetical protein M3282_09230 [Gemmatimonadota bacterium]|nr:hypothetical protein [Gemmatimonadota bacterium]